MKEKKAYPDIGELGWSLYLSAHLRWLREKADSSLAVITSPDRKCLYKDSASLIFDIPADFYCRFKGERNCFGLHPPAAKEIRAYFERLLPFGYSIPANFSFGCNRRFLADKVIYRPYEYSRIIEGKKRILVFPRYRVHEAFSFRNLPEWFYIGLVDALCDEFPDYEIKTIGISSGTYNIDMGDNHSNYVNGVVESVDLQDVIDEFQMAIATVGGASSLPKISVLQSVPTFIVGHERKRCTKDENWMGVKMGFYEVAKDSYGNFDFKDCTSKILDFVKEVMNE